MMDNITASNSLNKEKQRKCILGMSKHVQRSRPQRHRKKLFSHLIAIIGTKPFKLRQGIRTIVYLGSTNTASKLNIDWNQVGVRAQTKRAR